MYGEGHGVPQDFVEEARWYRMAAEQGFALAQFSLGVMYGKGEGVPQDYVAAHKWFNLSAEHGHQTASKSRRIFAELMTPAQIAEAERLAREWTEKHRK